MSPLAVSAALMGAAMISLAFMARWVWRDHVRLLQQEEREREGTRP